MKIKMMTVALLLITVSVTSCKKDDTVVPNQVKTHHVVMDNGTGKQNDPTPPPPPPPPGHP